VLFGPDESNVNLEENAVVKMLLDKPEDKSRVKELAQKIQKFYFRDKRITYAPDSGMVDVSVFGFWFSFPHTPSTMYRRN
jgi:hypothetical protein